MNLNQKKKKKKKKEIGSSETERKESEWQHRLRKTCLINRKTNKIKKKRDEKLVEKTEPRRFDQSIPECTQTGGSDNRAQPIQSGAFSVRAFPERILPRSGSREGRLDKNMVCHETCSISQPPMTGPIVVVMARNLTKSHRASAFALCKRTAQGNQKGRAEILHRARDDPNSSC